MTIFPKTNYDKTFAERLVARSDKGRVYGLGISQVKIDVGATWVDATASTFVEATDKTGKTASFTGGSPDVKYRWRTQTRPTDGDGTLTNGSWTSYDGVRQDVTFTLPATGVDIRIHAQAKDGSVSPTNSFTGFFAVLAA